MHRCNDLVGAIATCTILTTTTATLFGKIPVLVARRIKINKMFRASLNSGPLAQRLATTVTAKGDRELANRES